MNYSKNGDFFQFDEATDTIDSCVITLKQCAHILGYNKGHILDLFRNTLPTRYYHLFFGSQQIGEAVESA